MASLVKQIPFNKPSLGPEEDEAVLSVLHSGWLAAGPETEAFEQEFSTYISPPGEKYYCIFTNSCTSALKIAYKYYFEKGERAVIVPKNTFCATYSAAEELGMKSYFREDLNKNMIDIGHAVTVNMFYGGVKPDSSFSTIEDSAHRIEANDPLKDSKHNTAIRCYSFYVTKNLTCGSGGMFVTADKDIYDYARLQWRDGLTTSTADRAKGFTGYTVEALAGGYDGNDLAAAIGRVQLRHLPEFTKRRNEIVARYNAGLDQSWTGNHLYPFIVKDEPEVYRCIAWMKDKGIACSHHYPNTGWNGVSLPIYPLLTDKQVDYIIDQCKLWREQCTS